MDFDELCDQYMLSGPKILELVDEYDLYCHYLEFQPDTRTAYSSPFREDPKPSFSLFESKYYQAEYAWKDSGLNISGDIFHLVKHLKGLRSIEDAYRKIDTDFKLGFGSSKPITEPIPRKHRRPTKPPAVITIQSRPFEKRDREYWGQYGISEATLKRYNVMAVKYFWTHTAQEHPSVPYGVCYAYKIGKYYKLYQPFNPACKFLTDFPEHYAEGVVQLSFQSDTLVITKSMKEVMWFWEHLRLDAIAGKSESTPLPEALVRKLMERYKKIIVFLDNDAAGWKAAYQYQQQYGFAVTAIPKCLFRAIDGKKDKDPTDLHASWGLDQAKIVVNYCLKHESKLRTAA